MRDWEAWSFAMPCACACVHAQPLTSADVTFHKRCFVTPWATMLRSGVNWRPGGAPGDSTRGGHSGVCEWQRRPFDSTRSEPHPVCCTLDVCVCVCVLHARRKQKRDAENDNTRGTGGKERQKGIACTARICGIFRSASASSSLQHPPYFPVHRFPNRLYH